MSMSNIIEQAKAIRDNMDVVTATLTDEQALEVKYLYLPWKVDTEYAVDAIVRFNDTLYKCLTAHTSQETWIPTDAPSLWVRMDDPSEEYPKWVQPLGSTDAYALGAKVSHNDKHWVSNVDSNVWEPGVYGWDEITE